MNAKDGVSNREESSMTAMISRMLSISTTVIGLFLAVSVASAQNTAQNPTAIPPRYPTVQCKFKGKPGHEIRVEVPPTGKPAKVEVRFGGDPLMGYNARLNVLTGAMARKDSGILLIAKAGGIDMRQVERVGLFVINKDGLLLLHFESKNKPLGMVAHLFGTNYLCE